MRQPRLVKCYLCRALCLSAVWLCAAAVAAKDFHVSPDGDDTWTGALPTVNAQRTDGPLASLHGALEALRAWRQAANELPDAVTVHVHAGRYLLAQPLTFTPDDSGTAERPVTFRAADGESVELCGGRPVTGWTTFRDGILVADLPTVKSGEWRFRSLFINGRRLRRARYPNVDPDAPLRGGFLYTANDPYAVKVGCIHNAGDWIDYDITVPADGAYRIWTRYAAQNGTLPPPCIQTRDMGERVAFALDGGADVLLTNLPDTGDWRTMKWARNTALQLTKGKHRLRWKNLRGGGVDIDCFVFTTDEAWQPKTIPVNPPAEASQLFVVQAEEFVAYKAPQLKTSNTITNKNGGTRNLVPLQPGTAKPEWAGTGRSEVHIFPTAWNSCRAFKVIAAIQSVAADGTALRVDGPECLVDLAGSARFFVENVIEELDQPGEWFLDEDAGKLYCMPDLDRRGFYTRMFKTSPFEGQDVLAPVLGRMIVLAGESAGKRPVQHVRFEGFTVTTTDYEPDKDDCGGYHMGREGVFHFVNAQDCDVRNCHFRNIGKHAVCAIGCERLTLAANTIEDAAEGGILLRNDTSKCVVSNNHIHHIGRVYKHVAGVTIDRGGSDNRITHNHIHHSSRYCVSLKYAGERNEIGYNHVHHGNEETYDTGLIEVTQRRDSPRSGGRIVHNLIHDAGGYGGITLQGDAIEGALGVYLDSFAAGYEVAHNLVYNCRLGVFVQGGADNSIHDNIVADNTHAQIYCANHLDNATNTRLSRNVLISPGGDSAAIRARSPDAEHLSSDNNLLFRRSGDASMIVVVGAGAGSLTPGEWRERGFDLNSTVADPRLRGGDAPAAYELLPESPAQTLGFEPIDLQRVGIGGGEPGKKGQ